MYEADLAVSVVSFISSSIGKMRSTNHQIQNNLVKGHHLYTNKEATEPGDPSD
jgi:hypothetical protein